MHSFCPQKRLELSRGILTTISQCVYSVFSFLPVDLSTINFHSRNRVYTSSLRLISSTTTPLPAAFSTCPSPSMTSKGFSRGCNSEKVSDHCTYGWRLPNTQSTNPADRPTNCSMPPTQHPQTLSCSIFVLLTSTIDLLFGPFRALITSM